MAGWPPCSGRGVKPRHLPPLPEALGAEVAVVGGGEEVTTRTEVVLGRAEGLQKLLGVPRRFEALQRPFSFPDRLVGVLRPVVQALVPPVLRPGQHLAKGGRVARELVTKQAGFDE